MNATYLIITEVIYERALRKLPNNWYLLKFFTTFREILDKSLQFWM